MLVLKILFVVFNLRKALPCYSHPSKDSWCTGCSWDEYLNSIPSNFQVAFELGDCLPKKSKFFKKDYYISSRPCVTMDCGDGTRLNPFSRFINALFVIHKETAVAEVSEINVFLMFNEDFPLHYVFANADDSNVTLYFFKRLRSNITVQPLYCTDEINTDCLNISLHKASTISIYIQSATFTIFISSSLTIKNVIINGIDLSFYNKNKHNDSNSYMKACNDSSVLDSSSDCSINSSYANVNESSLYFSGLFILEALADCGECDIPSLKFENVEIRYINPFSSYYTYTSLVSSFPSFIFRLEMENVSIYRCHFRKGLFAFEENLPLYITNPLYISRSVGNLNLFSNEISLIIKGISIVEMNYFQNDHNGSLATILGLQYSSSSAQEYFIHSYRISISNLFISNTIMKNGVLFLFENFPLKGRINLIAFDEMSLYNCSVKYFIYGAIPSDSITIQGLWFVNSKNLKIQALNHYSNTRASMFLRMFTVENHFLDDSLIDLKEAFLNISDGSFLNITSYSLKSIIQILTSLKKVPINYFTLPQTSNETKDEIYIRANFFNLIINSIVSFDGVIRVLSVQEALFFYIDLGTSQSLFLTHIETFLECRLCKFLKLRFRSAFTATFVRNRNFSNILFSEVSGSLFEGNHVQNSNRDHLFYIAHSRFTDVQMESKVNFFDISSRQQTAYIDLLVLNVSFTRFQGPGIGITGIYLFYIMRLQVIIFRSVLFDNISSVAGIGFYKILDNPSNYPSWIEMDGLEFQNRDGVNFRSLIDLLYITNLTLKNSIINAESPISEDFFIFLGSNQNLGMLIIENCSFSHIKAQQYGALRINIFNADKLLIKNCNFFANSAPIYGTDIDLIFKERANISLNSVSGVRDSNFKSSYSIEVGAILLTEYGSILIKNCSFFNTSSKTRGSALTMKKFSIAIVINISFYACFSEQSGGAIWIESGANLACFGSNFTNTKGGLGGAAFIEGDATFSFSLIQNSTAQEGGAFYLSEGSAKIDNSLFMQSFSKLRGGHIFAKEGSIVVRSSKFLRGVSEENGGSTFLELMKSVTFTNVSFEKCVSFKTATVFLYSLSNVKSNFTKISFLGNYADFYSCLVAEEGEIHLEDSVFFNNSASKQGTAQFFSNFQISNSKIVNITMDQNFGGETVINTGNHDMIITKGSFKLNNFSKRFFSSTGGSLNLTSIEIKVASKALLAAWLVEGIHLDMFINEVSIDGGGACAGIFAKDSSLLINLSSFLNCKAATGAVLNLEDSDLNLQLSEFKGNEAENGGVLQSTNSHLDINQCFFKKNSALVIDKTSDIFVNNWLSSENFTVMIKLCNFSEFSYNSVYLQSGETAELSNLTFVNPEKLQTSIGSLFIKDFKTLILQYTNFSNIDQGGALSLDFTGPLGNLIFIERNYFINCSIKTNGGAIKLVGTEVKIKIIANLFDSNLADMTGGAIYIDCLSENCEVNISSNSFSKNRAKVYGNSLSISRNMSLVLVENNYNRNSNDSIEFSGYPSKIMLLIIPEEVSQSYSSTLEYLNNNSLKPSKSAGVPEFQMVSGPKVNLGAVIFDNYENFYQIASVSSLEIKEELSGKEYDSEPVLLENNKLIIDSNFPVFQGFSVVAMPDNNYAIEAVFSNKDYLIKEKFLIKIRKCVKGEVFFNKQCIACQRDLFSLEKDPILNRVSSCIPCSKNAWCLGGDKILSKEGFYRSSDDSTIFIKCYYKYACPDQKPLYINWSQTGFPKEVTSSFYFQQCAKNYEGPLCALCREGFELDTKFTCIECRNDEGYLIKMLFSLVISSFIMIYQAYELWNFSEIDHNNRGLLKILINHMYYLTFLIGFNINWSEDLSYFIKIVNQYTSVVPSEAINLSCFLLMIFEKKDVFFLKNVLMIFLPLLLLFVCLVIRFIFELLKITVAFALVQASYYSKADFKKLISRESLKIRLQSNLLSLSIIIFYNIYTRLLVNTVKFLSCIELDEKSSLLYLEINPTIECYSEEHLKYIYFVFLPNTLVWCLGWPLLIFFFVWTRKKSRVANSPNTCLARQNINIDFEQIRNFFILDYRSSAYYWELVFYVIGLLTAILQVTTSRLSTLSQGGMLSGLYALALLISETKRPFRNDSINKMNSFSYLIIIVTICLSVLTSIEKIEYQYQTFCLMAIYSGNALFYSYWLFIYVKIVVRLLVIEAAQSVRRKLLDNKFRKRIKIN